MTSQPKKSGLVKEANDPRSKDDIISNIIQKHPVELEEQISTLDKPLIIECASPGWQPKEWPSSPDAYPNARPPNYETDDLRFPAVPCTLDEQATDIVQAVEEGCAASHIHPRDPEDCLASSDMGLLSDVYDRIFERTDVVSFQNPWEFTAEGGVDYITPTKQYLTAAGGSNRYVQGAYILWPPIDRYSRAYGQSVRETLEFFDENGIKPLHKVRGSYHTRKLHREIVSKGFEPDADDPLVVIHDMGLPYGWPMDNDTWNQIELISTLEQTKDRFPDNLVTGVYSGNRNWLPVTLLAILTGVDMVRVGIEDPYWMYPHKNEVIQRTIDCVQKITDFCALIGRDLATTEQTRDILGIEAP